ncbi:ribbon-helix-helix protein, CopG family [Pirellulaceae bacterium SH449]
MGKASQSVSFRLQQEILEVLDERCKTSRLSRGELCRALVTSALISSENEELYGHLQCLENRLVAEISPVKKFSKCLAYLLNAVLVASGKLSREQAADFVRTEFLDKLGESK